MQSFYMAAIYICIHYPSFMAGYAHLKKYPATSSEKSRLSAAFIPQGSLFFPESEISGGRGRMELQKMKKRLYKKRKVW